MIEPLPSHSWTRRRWLASLPAFSLLQAQSTVESGDIAPDWTVLYGHPEFSHAEGMLGGYLQKLTTSFEAERERVVSSVKTPAEVEAYQSTTRRLLQDTLGSWPERTALNPKPAGKIERPEFVIEKVIFGSRPGVYVTANVYVPRKAAAPFPAVLASVGHWGAGKAFPDYQQLAAYLAERGVLVLVYDLPGMGERVETWNPVTRRPFVHPGTSEYFVTTEHGLAAGRMILTSGSLLPYLLWDAMRAMDYLAGRPDVDTRRMAATGVSGGGWYTEALAAIDSRVRVAIPVCYGGCTADNLFRAKIGILDVDALMAPRPLLLIEATGDTRESVAGKLRRREFVGEFYRAAGAGDRTKFMIADGPHGYDPPMFPVIFDWLARWLPVSRPPESGSWRPAVLESEAALACTNSGQVATSLGGKTLFTLAKAEVRRLAATRALPRERSDCDAWRGRLRKRLSERLAMGGRGAALSSSVLGRSDKGAYMVERLVYRPEPDIFIPALLFLPKKQGPAPTVVVVNEEGKSGGEIVDRLLAPLCKAGCAVLAIDPRGVGETAAPPRRSEYAELVMGGDASHAYTALRADRTLIGMRVFDLMRAADYIEARPELDRKNIAVVGIGSGGLLALCASVLDSRFLRVGMAGTVISYAAVVENEYYAHALSGFVPGALRDFDLPELAALLAPRPLLLVNPVDGFQRRSDPKRAAAEYKGAGDMFRLEGAAAAFQLAFAETPGDISRLFLDHFKAGQARS
jgi:dienelactone hydrolase